MATMNDTVALTLPEAVSMLHINDLPILVLIEICSKLTIREIIKLRIVCQHWKNTAEEFCRHKHMVTLNLVHDQHFESAPLMQRNRMCPVPPVQKMKFKFSWTEPVNVDDSAKATITIEGRHFNSELAEAFGPMFPKMTCLVIHFGLIDTESHMANLLLLLQQCTHIEKFAFVMARDVSSNTTLPSICATIDTKMTKLKQLDLFVSDYNINSSPTFRPHDYQPAVELSNVVQSLDHFAISCAPLNLCDILMKTGKRSNDVSSSANACGLKSLSIQCRMSREDTQRLFATNPELSRVTRLQLNFVWNGNMVLDFLEHFNNVDELKLIYWRSNFMKFEKLWIEGFSKFKHLTKLTLVGFIFGPLVGDLTVTLSNITELTIASPSLISEFIRYFSNTVELINKNPLELFAVLINSAFPSLLQLTVLAGELCWPNQSTKNTEKELENFIRQKCPRLTNLNVQLTDPLFTRLHDPFKRARVPINFLTYD